MKRKEDSGDEMQSLRDEVERLNNELSNFKSDGNFGLFFALNRKLNELAMSLNSFELDLQAEDKAFERYIKLSTSLKETIEASNWLRINYLKMDENEAKEAEKKGVPIIETLAKKNNGKQENN